ncbi:hypothetical protein [Bacillus sp. B1-b2]|uniref:hypothetical protein n=1 Tax=Bacillus sp. B1-b2 TaxID=2653201 RepID=UPI0018698F72|nr:hypothetical protein [Bacillus sp. B1-b2]
MREYRDIKNSDDEDVYDKFIERIIKNSNAKSAYLALVRIFGNEIKRKREEVLISSAIE